MAFKFSISIGSKKEKETPAPVQEEKPKVVEPVVQEVTVLSETDEFEAKYGAIVRREFQKWADKLETASGSAMPIASPGRVSLYDGFRSMVPNPNSPVPEDFDHRIIEFIQNLAMWNRHISYAVDNIITLANTEYTIDFGQDVPEAQVKKMKDHLSTVVENWYEYSEGENSLDNDLLAQLATAGAISAEAVIKPDLSGINNIVRVNPANIRFAYDQAISRHIPLQQISGGFGAGSTGRQAKYPGYVELNPVTYTYIGMRRFKKENPTAVPPFMSALEDIITEKDMVANLRNVMRRMGMLGFLSVLLQAPKPMNETPEQYAERLSKYLSAVKEDVQDGFNRGIVIGYKDSHEFKMEGNKLNADGAEQLMKIVKSLIFAGVKQDPNMHGENYATTETFGRVILTKMAKQAGNYQLSLGAAKAKFFKMELMMAGFRFKRLFVKYKMPMIGDRFKEAQADQLEFKTAQAEFFQGLISQETLAQKRGYEKPFLSEPVVNPSDYTLPDPAPDEGGQKKKQ